MLAITAIKAFFTSGLGKDLLGILAIIALVFGIYSWGHSNGETDGYKKGFDAQQPTIDNLVKTINTYRTAVAAKVQAVETHTADATVAAVQQQATQQAVRTQIVEHYNTVEKLVASACAVDVPTVTAVNQLLATQTVYDDMAPLPDTNIVPVDPPPVKATDVPEVNVSTGEQS